MSSGSGYPQPPPGYGYGGYGQGQSQGPPSSQPHPTPPYGGAPPSAPYASAPPGPHGSSPYSSSPYGNPSPYGGPSAPYAPAPGEKPPKDNRPGVAGPIPPGGGYPPASPYGSPFASLLPSTFPPGTDPSIVACFQLADQDRSGFIDDKELQGALSSYNQSFSVRTVHLLMYLFTSSNVRKIGPKEFTSLFYSLQNWRQIFERFDRDRSGKIDTNELREALLSLGFAVPPVVLDLLVTKFDKTGGRNKAIEYDNFIECCLIVQGLTGKFKEKDTSYSGSATFTYEAFMLAVLPFVVA